MPWPTSEMRVGEVRIDVESALILRNCGIEFAAFVQKTRRRCKTAEPISG